MATESDDLPRLLIERFKRLNRLIHRNFARNLFPGNSPGELFVMGKLRRAASGGAGGRRVSDIAQSLGVTASSVTQIVTGLEERGLVRRGMDPQDRRAVLVSLTEAGEEAMRNAAIPFEAKFGELVSRLGAGRARELAALLAEVDDFFTEAEEARPDPAPEGPCGD
ncbi:MAG: MarR family transcriptional regulator [Spirochaetaceae bacterium]|nr:MarR family transcriptional regulator [Spirochaetaceae bacterium]